MSNILPNPFEQMFNVEKSNEYHVTIYKSLTGRWCVRHPSGRSHRKDFASLRYTKEFCKAQSWKFTAELPPAKH